MKNAVIVGVGVIGLATVVTVGYKMVKKHITSNDITDVVTVNIIEDIEYSVEGA